MNIESPIKYGPKFPTREQLIEVFNDQDQEIEGLKTTVTLYIDEVQRQLEATNSPKIERLLINVDVGIIYIDTGFLSLARDCYYATYDILENDYSLTMEEQIQLAEGLKILQQKIDYTQRENHELI